MFSCCAAWNQRHRDNIESFFCPVMPLPGWTLGRSNNAWLWSWLDLFTNRPNQIVPGSSIGVFILVKYFTSSKSNMNFKIKKTHNGSAHGGQRSSSIEKEQMFVKNKKNKPPLTKYQIHVPKYQVHPPNTTPEHQIHTLTYKLHYPHYQKQTNSKRATSRERIIIIIFDLCWSTL